MITEDYVSFEVAKLLKEKGFDESCIYVYRHDGSQDTWDADKENIACQKPTLQMVMKWLREEKHYYIQVMLDGWVLGFYLGYYVVIQKTDSDFEMMLSDVCEEVFYKTYEEACEAAIKYCLNLI